MKERTRVNIDLRWFAPVIIASIGAAFEELRQPIKFAWPIDSEVFGPIIVQLLVGGAYLIFEIVYAAKRETSTRSLQVDGLISYHWFGIAIGTVVVLYYNDLLLWCFPVAVLITWLDGAVGPWLAINNASQKPIVVPDSRANT